MKEGYTLITGASKGIGLELTKIFAKNHHNLILVARSKDVLIKLKDNLTKEYNIKIEVIVAEGGSGCAGITAASVALVDAGIPMKDIVVGCAAGKVNDKIVLDLSEVEDKEGQADVPIAMMPRTGEITLLQSDGDLSQEEFEEAINLAMEGCRKVNEIQKEALMKKYSAEMSD